MSVDSPLTFVIFTFNEEGRIERVLRNLGQHGPILIVDNFSEDATVEIARSYFADVLMHKNKGWVEDFDTVEKVKAAVSTQWIYWGYADEMLDLWTLDDIIKEISSESFDIINIARKNYYYGRFCHDAYMNRMNRIFRKDAIDFSANKIHHFGKPSVSESRILNLDSDKFVHHFISNTSKSYLRSIDTYSDIESERQSLASVSSLLKKLIRSFFGNYILRGGYKAGAAGLFLALQTLYYEIMVIMKIFERKNGLSIDKIEYFNNKNRDLILEKAKGRK